MSEPNRIINEPLYPLAHAAHYLRLNPVTLSTWVYGRHYQAGGRTRFSKPLVELERNAWGCLSFLNLVEAHVLRAMRKIHGIPMKTVRKAIDFVSAEMKCERPLSAVDFEVDGRQLFVHHLGNLVDLSDVDQKMLGDELLVRLKRIDRNIDGIAEQLYPMTRPAFMEKKIVVINPAISHGRPMIKGIGVSTEIIADRWRAGDPFEILHRDYGITVEQYDEALWYEQLKAA